MDGSTNVEKLKRQLRKAKQRAKKEQQRAEEADKERQRERQRADALKRQTQPTIINKYIAVLHNLVFSRFEIEQDRKLTSKGSITNPRNKWCPTYIQPWSDFIQQQKITFGTIYDTFPADNRIFENRTFLTGLGKRISGRRILNEKTLESFFHINVEDPVKTIINQLRKVEKIKNAFDLGKGIIFKNHIHAINDVAGKVVYRDTPSTPPATPNHNFDLNRLRPD
ncbi:hypothetical protein PoMZ_01710 [Pyricularia oryzae]|uniref:Uncharacterized protein n=1 Tax=Pyricularia oryzae TaxID=318829 RepID=A0A4P7N9G9_PYROR|nr:hypothetical protein PoMZ_01710 [Pyricularia oryzae]